MIVDAFTISAAVIALVVIVTVVSLMRSRKSVNKLDD
jgi:uncharacterized protein YoxC